MNALQKKIVEKKIEKEIETLLKRIGIRARLFSRIKSNKSITQKIAYRNILPSQILDVIGIRIVTNSIKNCYVIMELITKKWEVLNNKIKDYIAIPKINGYRSIHLTINHQGKPVEIQIRTFQMNQEANFGKASKYKHYAKN